MRGRKKKENGKVLRSFPKMKNFLNEFGVK